jgi:hypothetical protein
MRNDQSPQVRTLQSTPRRGFLRRVAGVAAAAATWRLNSAAAAGAALVALGGRSVIAAPGYYTPTHIPAGFRLTFRDSGRRDGFAGGATEHAWIFHNASHPDGYNRPLLIFQADRPQRQLAATTGRQGTPVAITLDSGQQVQAEYHDGWWALAPDGRARLVWDTSDVHSLILTRGGVVIGIRGSRVVRVTRDELVRVAAGLV